MLLVAAFVVAFAGAPGDVTAEFRSVVERAVPKRGVYEAHYVNDEVGPEVRIGIDFGSGAWYMAQLSHIMGVDESGQCFWGDAGMGRSKPSKEDCTEHAMQIGTYMPVVALWIAQKHPKVVRSVIETSDGYEARLRLQEGQLSEFELIVHTDLQGKVIQFSRDGIAPALMPPLAYSDTAPLFVKEISIAGLRLVSADESVGKVSFSRARVESISSQLKMNQAKAEASKRKSELEASGGAATLPAVPPEAAWRTPLVATGIALIVVGAIAYVRRRAR